MGFSGGGSGGGSDAGGFDQVNHIIPQGWNNNLKAGLARALAGGFGRLCMLCDSLGEGMWASDLDATSWAGIITQNLQAIYGDGGSGIRHPGKTDTWLTQSGVLAAAITQYRTQHNIGTAAGAWASNTAEGIWGLSLTTVDIATPGSITDRVRGETVNVYTVGNNGANAPCRVDVDGGSGSGGQTLNMTDTSVGIGPVIGTISGLANITHTVKVTYTGTGANTLFYAGMEGVNPTGLVIDNMGGYALRATQFATQQHYGGGSDIAACYMGGYRHPADGVLIALGANDAAHSTTGSGDVWAQAIRQIIAGIRDGAQQTLQNVIINGAVNPDISIGLLMHHIGAFDGQTVSTPVYQDYCARAEGISRAFNAAVINMWAEGENSYNEWVRLGHWGTSANLGAAGNDAIHLSDVGHAHLASVIQPILTT